MLIKKKGRGQVKKNKKEDKYTGKQQLVGFNFANYIRAAGFNANFASLP